ncbi:hypothetical protein CERSUDRAFT_97985 [Gelatoporia subvermispora B]|uniref:Uncharacterized protein n=1 Tax=Ceriporiopsis subvermispora (strain B) TaxID=914234 RepID=M2PDY7_CERS8|nr:hypothetical protein CERSUDRAFT_97985 [Gelatoporia subvermispora B]
MGGGFEREQGYEWEQGSGNGTSNRAGEPFDEVHHQFPTPTPTFPQAPMEYSADDIKGMPEFPSAGASEFPAASHERGFVAGSPQGQPGSPSQAPPAYTPPPSGFRTPLTGNAPFPAAQQAGPPVCVDADGRSPVFVGSAIFEKSVHPCKIAPHLTPACRVSFGGKELEHHGRYDLLPFDPRTMEWVPASHGQIPPGRRPVEGGYEENGTKLYHGLATIRGVRVPGKTAEHLGGCNAAFGGAEHVVRTDYAILCWK